MCCARVPRHCRTSSYEVSEGMGRRGVAGDGMGVKGGKVSLSDALEVRCGPLYEKEVWNVLCHSAKALQDIFLRGK